MGIIDKIEEAFTGHSKTGKTENEETKYDSHAGSVNDPKSNLSSGTDMTAGGNADHTNVQSHGTAPGNPPAGLAALGYSSMPGQQSSETRSHEDHVVARSHGTAPGNPPAGAAALGYSSVPAQQATGHPSGQNDQYGVARTAEAGLAQHETSYAAQGFDPVNSDRDFTSTSAQSTQRTEYPSNQQGGLTRGAEAGAEAGLVGEAVQHEPRKDTGQQSLASAPAGERRDDQSSQTHDDKQQGSVRLKPNAENPSAIPTAGGQRIGAGSVGDAPAR